MRYLPKSPSERKKMLEAIGVRSAEELFSSIPEQLRLKKPLNLPAALSEPEIIDYFKARANENSKGYTSFLGAGVYNHLRSVVSDTILLRGEFLTSYTPYQAEISQGTLQAIFEFQTMMCQLTGQDVANASMWDGSTATTEAVLMADRITDRKRVVIAKSVHPEYRQVLATYAKNLSMEIIEVGWTATGQMNLDEVRSLVHDDTSCVVTQSPNFFGVIEPVAELANIAHAKNALLVVAIAEAVSLGAMKAPEDADIVAMETQSLGLPPSYGGPYAGVMATRDKFVRQLPGRLAGQTTDVEGRRGFVLTLATREQHIRREKATSNICTNQALCALAVTVHLSLLGKEGLKEMAAQNIAKARFAAELLAKIPGVKLAFSGASFNEFVIELPRSVKIVNQSLLREKIIGPLPLGVYYPQLTKNGLVCVTETTSRGDIEKFAGALEKALKEPL
jgi:glycine dehydrogenase subunit 1